MKQTIAESFSQLNKFKNVNSNEKKVDAKPTQPTSPELSSVTNGLSTAKSRAVKEGTSANTDVKNYALRLPVDLASALRILAAKKGISFNTLVYETLKEHWENDPEYQKILREDINK